MHLHETQNIPKEEAYRQAVDVFYKRALKKENKSRGVKENETEAIVKQLEEAKEAQRKAQEELGEQTPADEAVTKPIPPSISYPDKPYTEAFLKAEQDEITVNSNYVRERNVR